MKRKDDLFQRKENKRPNADCIWGDSRLWRENELVFLGGRKKRLGGGMDDEEEWIQWKDFCPSEIWNFKPELY
jgi:hypothetical protein